MNSRERVVEALNLREPDRVPLFEMHIPPKISSRILAKDDFVAGNTELCYDLMARGYDTNKLNERISEELVDLHDKTGLDFIRVPGAYTKVKEIRRESEGIWVIDGKRYRYSAESLWNLDEPRYYDPDDVLRECHQINASKVDEAVFSILRHIVKRIRNRLFLSFDADGSWGPIVSNPNLLLSVMTWMYTRPDVVEALIGAYTSQAIKIGRAAIDEGADAILMCVDYGHATGPWMSPAKFRSFVKPALMRQIDAFNRKGAFAILHSDGNIAAILRDVVDAGIDAYQGIDVMAGMDLKAVKEEYGGRTCLIGNVNPRIIEFGTKEEVKREVLRCIEDGAHDGGYILSASANISNNSNADNFLCMLDYARKIGRYPLGLQPR